MKQGLTLPTSQTNITPAKVHITTNEIAGMNKRVAMQKARQIEFEKLLDKWKQSGHTVMSSDELIACIRGDK